MTSVRSRGDEARQAHRDEHMRMWGEGGGLHARREAVGGTGQSCPCLDHGRRAPGPGGSLCVLLPLPTVYWACLRQAEQTNTGLPRQPATGPRGGRLPGSRRMLFGDKQEPPRAQARQGSQEKSGRTSPLHGRLQPTPLLFWGSKDSGRPLVASSCLTGHSGHSLCGCPSACLNRGAPKLLGALGASPGVLGSSRRARDRSQRAGGLAAPSHLT